MKATILVYDYNFWCNVNVLNNNNKALKFWED